MYCKFQIAVDGSFARSMASNRRSKRRLSFEDTQVCSLCMNCHQLMSKPAEWKNEDARAFVDTLIEESECLVCRLCRNDITRVLSNDSYIPRWEEKKEKSSCCVSDCESVAFASRKSSAEMLGNESVGLKCSRTVIPIPTPFCKHHYYLVYKTKVPFQANCVTCNASLKKVQSRKCPHPNEITQYLINNAGFEGTIEPNDKVCYTCYKSHLAILQKSKEMIISTDEDLEDLLASLSTQVHPIDKIHTSDDVIDAAMILVSITVGKHLLAGEAILLPTVQDIFHSTTNDILQQITSDLTDVNSLVTAQRILSILTVLLQHHLAISCKVRKYGTLLYRPNVDFNTLLAQNLWEKRNHSQKITCTSCAHSNSVNVNSSQKDFLLDLNKLVHSQIHLWIHLWLEKGQHTLDHDNISTDELQKEIDPKLWEAICTLTMSSTERRGSSKVNDPSSQAYHIKKIRRLFLICLILFITDDRCSFPLHTLITDIVESQGGSALLIKILNRLGVCVSSDTLSRFIEHKVQTSDIKRNGLAEDSFTIISTDNLDFLHSYAQVYQGNQKNSWHGTTIQAVQPIPSLSLVEQNEFDHLTSSGEISEVVQNQCLSSPNQQLDSASQTQSSSLNPYFLSLDLLSVDTQNSLTLQPVIQTEGQHTSYICTNNEHDDSLKDRNYPHPATCIEIESGHLTRKRVQRSSPISSPLKVTHSPAAKMHRRARTGMEGTCKKIDNSIPAILTQVSFTPQQKGTSTTGQSLSDFHPNGKEQIALQEMQEEINTYMMYKVATQKDYNFLNLQDFLSVNDATHREKSQVAYLEVMDAVADSKDTVIQILHDLHEFYTLNLAR